VRVDREDRPVERGRDQVVEDLAAHRAAFARGPDHGDGLRAQELPHRCGCRGPVALVEALERVLRHLCRKLDAHHVGLRARAHRESALAEHLRHAVVVREDLGLEYGHAALLGRLGEVGEQDRAEAVALICVGDLERELGAVVVGVGPAPRRPKRRS
jgi:hypothetical protein